MPDHAGDQRLAGQTKPGPRISRTGAAQGPYWFPAVQSWPAGRASGPSPWLPGYRWSRDRWGQPVWLVLDQRGEHVGRHGLGEVVALGDIAAEFLQSSGLLQGLDALGDHLFVERVDRVDDGGGEDGGLRPVNDVPDQR